MTFPKFIGREKPLYALQAFIEEKSKEGPPMAYHIHVTGMAGVGRTRFVDEFLKSNGGLTLVGDYSCTEGPLVNQLAAGVGLNPRAPSFYLAVLKEAWEKKLRALSQEESALLVLRDFQELDVLEREWILDFLCVLAQLPCRLFIFIECRSPMEAYLLPFSSDREIYLTLENFDKTTTGTWLESLLGEKGIDPEIILNLFGVTEGNPEKLWRWADFLQRNTPLFFQKKALSNWPGSWDALLARELGSLAPLEKKVLQTLAIHPSWVTTEFLAEVSGSKAPAIIEILNKFKERNWIRPHSQEQDHWVLLFSDLGEAAFRQEDVHNIQLLHARCFEYLRRQPDWLFLSTWLAYHASEGGLTQQAFCWNLLAGEAYGQNQKWPTAQAYLERALGFAESPFKRAYALGMLAESLLQQGRFPLALEKLLEAYRLSCEIPWSEFRKNYSLGLGQLLSHMGYFRESEKYFREGIELLNEMGFEKESAEEQQNLGLAYLEQARYREAKEVFEAVLKKYEGWEDLLGQITSKIGLIQIDISLGKGKSTLKLLEGVKASLPELPGPAWQPLLKLLLAKLQFTEGNRGKALRLLEDAAQGFEKVGDLNGKVEVLLAMSAPLLEYNMIEDAQSLIDLLGSWSELRRYPALQHSIQLRRLAIGAFSGHWNPEDIPLTHQDALKVGRTEDWLLFWFHMALASQKLEDRRFFSHFISQARKIVEAVGEQLDEGSRDSFFQRPDIARILRLSEGKKEREAPQVQAKRSLEAEGPAEAATLAPPIKGKGKTTD